MEIDLPFKAEYAKSGRAGCKGCKSTIEKGSLRLAAMVQVRGSEKWVAEALSSNIHTILIDFFFLCCCCCCYSLLSMMVSSPIGSITPVSSKNNDQDLWAISRTMRIFVLRIRNIYRKALVRKGEKREPTIIH